MHTLLSFWGAPWSEPRAVGGLTPQLPDPAGGPQASLAPAHSQILAHRWTRITPSYPARSSNPSAPLGWGSW
eukprot:scaffold31766_cov15-Tisochrysis_lutea.AAC.1